MKNVIDMNKNKLTGQYEIYTSTVEDYFTNNNIEQISIEEMTIDIDTCMQNFDKFYGIINNAWLPVGQKTGSQKIFILGGTFYEKSFTCVGCCYGRKGKHSDHGY